MRNLLFALCATLALLPASRACASGMLTGVDLMSSTVLQEKQSSFSGLGMRARLHPDRLVAGIEILPSIEYWRNSSTVTPYNIRATRKDATMAVDARYTFHYRNMEPYAGAGFGLHFLSNKINAPSLGLNEASDSVVKGGLAALAGVSFGMTSRLDNFIELKYHHIPDYKQLKINWGLAIKL